MANTKQLGKRGLIDKANQTMVATIAIAGFVVVFSIIASRALLSQRSYQSRVISQKQIAADQLKANEEAVSKLALTYRAFVDTPENVLGGNPTGTGDRDGTNARIVLDALPSKYDFPAFVTSVEKLLATRGFTATSVKGVDDELAQSKQAAGKKQPVDIPFTIEVTASSYQNAKDLLLTLEQSIRPIQVDALELAGSEGTIDVTVTGVSYYQAARGLDIEKKVVR